MKNIDSGNWKVFIQLIDEFYELKRNAIHKYANLINCKDCSGHNLRDSVNSHYVFDSHHCENVKYGMRNEYVTDSYDVLGSMQGELSYDSTSIGLNSYSAKFQVMGTQVNNCEYCDFCKNCSNCFGCVSMKDKEYCILNKQYTKEEYFELLPKIKEHMNKQPYVDAKGREYTYGEMFPLELSPFGYNETVAQEYFPLTKEEAQEREYNWKDDRHPYHEVTLPTSEIPDAITDVTDDIVNEVIECEDKDQEYSAGAFKILPQELKFYREMNVPLPRRSPNARHHKRLQTEHDFTLYKRTTEDGVEVLTPYSPDRPEKIYSEEGYNNRMY